MVFSNWFLTLQAQAVAALFLYSWARPDLESGIAGAEILIMLAMLSTQKLLIAFKYSLMLPRDYARMSTSRVDQARRLSEQLISGCACVAACAASSASSLPRSKTHAPLHRSRTPHSPQAGPPSP